MRQLKPRLRRAACSHGEVFSNPMAASDTLIYLQRRDPYARLLRVKFCRLCRRWTHAEKEKSREQP